MALDKTISFKMKHYLLALWIAFASNLEQPEKIAFAYPSMCSKFTFYAQKQPNYGTPVVVKLDSCQCRNKIQLSDKPYYPKVGDTVTVNANTRFCGKIKEVLQW